jgi:hypothetical protein
MKWIAAAALATLSCAPVPPAADPEPGGSAHGCSVERLGDLVGSEASSELGAEAIRRSGARRLRWIRPGDAVTMDYVAARLNVRLDQSGRVEAFDCG